MTIKNLSPYITLNGTAGEAIALYERVLGATTITIARAGDVPGSNVPPERRNRVAHSALDIGGSQLMLSDAADDTDSTAGNVHVALDFTDVNDLTRAFHGLAEAGTIMVPVQDTFWGAKFGMLTDRFGVRWLLNCDTRAA